MSAASVAGPPDGTNPERHYAWTLGMRDMRLAMARECDARIMVGGQVRGVSPWPGLLEELETSAGKPLYLIGAFGGATRLLIDVLRGAPDPVELSAEFQDEGGKRAPLRAYYESRAGAVDWPGRLQRVRKLGVAGLKNGLTRDDNERLFQTRNLTEMIALVLKGLKACFAPGPKKPRAKSSPPPKRRSGKLPHRR